MIDPRKITPLLNNTTVDREIGRGPNGTVYLVTRRINGKKMALKHISIPVSDAQTKALIFAGAVADEADAQRYYNSMVKDIKAELLQLNHIQNAANLLKFRGYQVDQKFIGSGFDVYLLSDYCRTLPEYLAAHPLTRLQAINLAIDLCSALEQLRSGGLLHRDVRPNNIYLGENRHFMVGDLGLSSLDELEYSAMPDQLITAYTAPEVQPADATLSPTMDIYSVGMILYEIYNGGLLPVSEDGTFQRTAGELPAPAYADVALSEIILKACAYEPGERYQNPAEMKQALVLYMQRGNVSSQPLVPPPPPSEDDASVDVSAIAATVEAGQAEEAEGASPDSTEPADTPDSTEPPEDGGFIMDDLEETKVIPPVLGKNDLLVPVQEEISIEEFLANARKTSGLEVVSMDSEGNTVIVPGYETEETLPEGTEFVDSADNHADIPSPSEEPEAVSSEDGYIPEIAQSQPEPEAPTELEPPAAPVKALPIRSIQPVEEEDEEEEEEVVPPPRRRRREPPRNDDPNVYDDGYEEEEEDDEDDEEPSGVWKKALICVIVLLVLAGGSFALYTFKTDTVQSIQSEVLSSSSIQIQATTKNGSGLEVVCSTSDGEVSRLPYTSGGVTFTGLSPSTSYTFSLESSDSKLLLGTKKVSGKTTQMTSLTGFTASSVSAVSATLVLAGSGPQPSSWIVTATSADGQTVTAESSDVQILVEGLTPATEYTATIARGDGNTLGGTTTCTFTTMDYTVLSSFEAEDVTTDSISVQWVYSGTVPDSWTVLCEGTDGSSTSQEVSGTECTLSDLSPDVTYTISLSCASLQATELSTITASVPSVNITEITSTQNEDGAVEVSWEYTGNVTPSEWSVSYAYASDGEVVPTLATTDSSSITLENLVPNATYTITVTSADGLSVGGTATTICETGSVEQFTDYGCSDVSMTLYVLEDNEDSVEPTDPTTAFTTSQHIMFSIQASYDSTEDAKTVDTLYVVRNSSGLPVYVYSSSRSWEGSWLTARHTGDLSYMPETPGGYTLEVYFDGQFMASADFTVTVE